MKSSQIRNVTSKCSFHSNMVCSILEGFQQNLSQSSSRNQDIRSLFPEENPYQIVRIPEKFGGLWKIMTNSLIRQICKEICRILTRICGNLQESAGICRDLQILKGALRNGALAGENGPCRLAADSLPTRCRLAAEMAGVPGRGITNSCRAVLSGGEKLGRRTW